MPKDASSFAISLGERPKHVTLTRWLLDELRRAILDGQLGPGMRLPATRDFARLYGLSRGTVVSVFHQLEMDGYVRGQVGSGTWVNEGLALRTGEATTVKARSQCRPSPLDDLIIPPVARPFRLYAPAVNEFPKEIWARLAGRRLRALSPEFLMGGDLRGFAPLREAIRAYLGSSRGVVCEPEQIVVLSGTQQGLDLLSRLLVKPGDPVWIEDPGYFGAAIAFRHAGAKLVPMPAEGGSVRVAEAKRRGNGDARLAYVTPGHQFPLGSTMSMDSRLELLQWAHETGAFVIEDDYDSEYRFHGNPVPSLHRLDRNGNVIFLGTFNKLLFPALRLGYVVLPPALVDPFMALRYGTELRCAGLDQAILCDFIVEGHLGRHIRRMRELYGGRLRALLEAGKKHLNGCLEFPDIHAGLHMTGILRNGMTSRDAEKAASSKGIESMGLDRMTLRNTDLQGLVLGFAGFDERAIRGSVAKLARALETKPRGGTN